MACSKHFTEMLALKKRETLTPDRNMSPRTPVVTGGADAAMGDARGVAEAEQTSYSSCKLQRMFLIFCGFFAKDQSRKVNYQLEVQDLPGLHAYFRVKVQDFCSALSW